MSRVARRPPPYLLIGVLAIGAACSGPSERASAQPEPAGLQAASSGEAAEFYRRFGWRPLWSDELAAQLRAALQDAPRHGLSAAAFLNAEPADPQAREAALTAAALAYADALAHGVVAPDEAHAIFTLERNRVDVAAGLHEAAGSGRVGQWLASLAPQDSEYAILASAYLAARQAASNASTSSIPDGSIIRPGDRDRRVPAIAERLRDGGYLPVGTAGRAYTDRLAASVRALQRDYGIAVDGVVGPDTLAALNTGPADRARQLAVNLERRRWLARQPAPDRIDVNIATTELTYVRDGDPAWRTRVVAGAPSSKTPLLGETFSQLVVNPPWYVPQSIAQEEILPKGQAYLRRNDMYVEDGRVIQRPGPQAALGRVKFDMQNRYAIYLHDTPAKQLFDRAERHRSHGCVRVEDAVAFARRLAQEQGKGEAFDAALASGETQVVELGQPLAVRLLYRTAYVAPDGGVRFAPDVYEWDAELGERMGLGRGPARQGQPVLAAPLGP